MSTRMKLGLSFLLLLIIMSALMNYSVSSSQRPPGGGGFSYWGIALVVLAGVGLVFIILIFMGWYDPFDRGRYESDPLQLVGLAVLGLIALAIVFLEQNGGLNSVYMQLRGRVNESHVIATQGPLVTSENTTKFSGSSSPVVGPDVLVLAAFIIGISLAAVFTLRYYRSLKVKRRRKELMARALQFDRKLDGDGLAMFSTPTEAVVGIYKNAVLWLEARGVPYSESWTHWEHAGHVKYMHDAFVGLTRLFEKAKYAPEKVTWDDAKEALELYRQIKGGVNAD